MEYPNTFMLCLTKPAKESAGQDDSLAADDPDDADLPPMIVQKPGTGISPAPMDYEKVLDKFELVDANNEEDMTAVEEWWDMAFEKALDEGEGDSSRGKRIQTSHIVCGSILPVWGCLMDALPSKKSKDGSDEGGGAKGKLSIVRVRLPYADAADSLGADAPAGAAKLAKSVPVSGSKPAIATTSAMAEDGNDVAGLPVVNPEDFTVIGVQVSSSVLEALEDRIDEMKDELAQGTTRTFQPTGKPSGAGPPAGGAVAPPAAALQPLLQMLAGGPKPAFAAAGAIDLTGD
jgi:hypothetical protein